MQLFFFYLLHKFQGEKIFPKKDNNVPEYLLIYSLKKNSFVRKTFWSAHSVLR